jgi:hypothetical protein
MDYIILNKKKIPEDEKRKNLMQKIGNFITKIFGQRSLM